GSAETSMHGAWSDGTAREDHGLDLATRIMEALGYPGIILVVAAENLFPPIPSEVVLPLDRKSTRLNSSHVKISYAVFCVKKKGLQHLGLVAEWATTHCVACVEDIRIAQKDNQGLEGRAYGLVAPGLERVVFGGVATRTSD